MAKKYGDYLIHHNSLADLVRWIDATPATWRNHSSTSAAATYAWDLNTGYAGALKLAQDGWQEGAKRMATALDLLPALDSQPRRSWGVAGGSVSVGRYFSGNPMCMRTRKRQQGHKPSIILAVNVCARGSTEASHMANYGLAITRYTQELEQAGYAVGVIAVSMAVQNDYICSHSWTVKEQGSPMNLADMAFSIGHPACFRRLGFAAWERMNRDARGYGKCLDVTADHLPQQYKGAIILNGINSAYYHSPTPEKAVEALRETVWAVMEQREAEYH